MVLKALEEAREELEIEKDLGKKSYHVCFKVKGNWVNLTVHDIRRLQDFLKNIFKTPITNTWVNRNLWCSSVCTEIKETDTKKKK